MPRYLGKGQVGICQRCGFKFKASELVNDGRDPQLRVCTGCADPAHPQERPFVPDDVEGVPRFKPSPENLPADTPAVLTADIDGLNVELSWEGAESDRWIADSYNVYRSVDGADPVLLGTVEVTYDLIHGTDPVLEYTDTTANLLLSNVYTVRAVWGEDEVSTSNEAIPS